MSELGLYYPLYISIVHRLAAISLDITPPSLHRPRHLHFKVGVITRVDCNRKSHMLAILSSPLTLSSMFSFLSSKFSFEHLSPFSGQQPVIKDPVFTGSETTSHYSD